NYLHHVRPGTKLPTIGPLGRFVMQEPIPYDTVFVATGTGVAPFIAMMGHIWDQGLDDGREFHMVFGVRYVHDLIYRDLIERWEREHRNFHFYPTISRPKPSGCRATTRSPRSSAWNRYARRFTGTSPPGSSAGRILTASTRKRLKGTVLGAVT